MSRLDAREYWEERLRSHPDLDGVGSLVHGRSFNRWLYRVRAHRFRAVVRDLELDVARSRVLDVGSGTGFYLDQWRRLGVSEVDGLDFASASVTRLRAAYSGSRILHADIADPACALAPAAYDVVSAFDVLFHVVDDARYASALGNVSRALRPGGWFLYSDNFVHRGRPPYGDYHYSRTLDAITGALEGAGLRLVRRVPMLVLLGAPDDSDRRLLRWWWRCVSGLARRGEWLGYAIGAVVFPLELVLAANLDESPTTEIAVCRKEAVPST